MDRSAREIKASAFHQRGCLAAQKNQWAAALPLFRGAVMLDPEIASYRNSLGLALWSLGRPVEAAAALARAVELEPHDVDYQQYFGDVLLECGRYEEAERAYRQALACNGAEEDSAPLLARVAAALARRAHWRESRRYWTRALAQEPGNLLYLNNLAGAWFVAGAFAKSQRLYRELAARPDCPAAAHSNFLFGSLFDPALSPGALFLRHQAWAARHERPIRPFPAVHRSARRRIRVGYCSPDLRDHSVSYFLRPILLSHDRDRFEIYCYANSTRYDATTQEFASLARRWREIPWMSDRAAARTIRDDGIDILVDLAGHTSGNRLPVFAYRPAPVQVTYLGYAATSGMSRMDYRITDGIADPPEMRERLHSEQLWRLSPCFLCYQPPDDAPPVRVDRNPAIRFGSFAPRMKINRRVLRLWAEVLRQVKGSELLLKGKAYDDGECRRSICSTFAKAGVAPERIIFQGFHASKREHLETYAGVDITLDTFPYNGTTTTCEALWMGSPLLTLAGRSHVARVSASILMQAGLNEWVTHSEEEYVRRAIGAAQDRPALERLRRGLRRRLRSSPLLDAARFTRQLEAAYRAMLQSHR